MKLNGKIIMLTFIFLSFLVVKVSANEIIIYGLDDSTTYYIGSSIKIRANSDNFNSGIEWKITGDESIIDYQIVDNQMQIRMVDNGKIWLMAKLTDGSDLAREYAINIESFPTELNKYIINGINPIMTKGYEGILQIEIIGNNQVDTLKKYLRHLYSFSNIILNDNYIENNYHYFNCMVGTKLIEIRLDKVAQEYDDLSNIMFNIDSIIGDENPILKPTPSIMPTSEPIDDSSMTGVPEFNKPNDVIFNQDNNYFIFRFNMDLNSNEKIAYINNGLQGISTFEQLNYIDKVEHDAYTSYFYETNNDDNDTFYIELQVESDDQEFIKIIEMLKDEPRQSTTDIKHLYDNQIPNNDKPIVQQSSMAYQSDNTDIKKMILSFILAIICLCWFYWFQNSKAYKK